ncbi:cupin domain-containing protein [Chloroflexota bacterium]
MEDKRLVKAHYEKTAYNKWMEQQEIPIVRGMAVEDVTQVPRAYWSYLGGPAAFIHLTGMEGWTGMYVAEIPPGASLNAEKHLYEEDIYILKGRGLTEVGLKENKQVFEWKEGSLFAPPVNTWYRMINGTQEPVIFLSITDAPLVMDIFHNSDFIFNCDYEFKDRYGGQEGYFSGEGPKFQVALSNVWVTNFIPDALTAPLEPQERKVAKGSLTRFYPSGNWLAGHIAQWPGGGYHKAHHHYGGVIILALNSKGYFLMWPKDVGTKPYQNGREDVVVKANFGHGTVISPPTGWFHQRFNTGPEAARQLAVSLLNHFYPVEAAESYFKLEDGFFISTREGGSLIEYEDEDPEIRKRFKEALRQEGVQCNMPPVVYRED